MKKVLQLFVVVLPWRVKRYVLCRFWGYEIAKSARIGLAYVFPGHLIMGENSKIRHFTVAIHLDLIKLGNNCSIGRGNWITGFPTCSESEHFAWQKDRRSELVVGDESSITKNHHIDCTNSIHIGHHVTIAGYNSQFLTHSIDVYENRQGSRPIVIGDYSFVSTHVIVLGGGELPAHSVLGAGAVLQKRFLEEWMLYAGVPARAVKAIPHSAKYFSREKGYVV